MISNGTGNDTFILPGASLGFDVIADFTKTNGDVVNLPWCAAGHDLERQGQHAEQLREGHRRRQQHLHRRCP